MPNPFYIALKAAHEAIEALLHAQQNPHSERIGWVAGEKVTRFRELLKGIYPEGFK